MRSLIIIVILTFCFTPGCSPQNLRNRQPVVADAFYASDPEVLMKDLKNLFNEAQPKKSTGNVQAIIVPHAGYPYSGVIAASGYNQIDNLKKYDNVFIIGSSHHVSFSGASIYNPGNYVTPLGVVKVNLKLANDLIKKNKVFVYNADADGQEHSIEVQLPFLQFIMKEDFQIVPILLGTHSADICYEIARLLHPFFNENNLFVISTDFSHYPDYENACRVDKETAEAIKVNSVETFVEAINGNLQKNIPELATCVCAWPAVLTLLYMTETDPEVQVDLIDYKNSGDTQIGDKSRVVGYNAISFSKPYKGSSTKSKADKDMISETDFSLNDKDKEALIKLSRYTLEQYIQHRNIPEIDTSGFSQNLFQKAGAFVTLNKEGQLRGCIGRFSPGESLYKVVQDMTISASTKDYRFTPVTPPELNKIEIEISVLTPLHKIDNIDEIELGKHGIYIKKDFQSGTFLPQVAAKTGWTKEEFLGYCARDKAQIGWDGWKDAEIYTYEAIVFSEAEFHNQPGLK